MAGKADERVAADPLAPSPVSDSERLAAHMAAVGQITPAVAHDLRGPINAMVFNLEILKESIASGRGEAPGGRDKLLRYVEVLREELGRLHRGLEAFLSLTTARGDKVEAFDLREPVGELASVLSGPARKQQVQIATTLPDHPIPVEANRHLLRQALLQVALAALAGVARGQTMRVALRDDPGQATLWLGGLTTPPEGIPAAPPEPYQASPEQALLLAGSLLAQQGGRVQAAEGPEGSRGYEVEWTTRTTG